MYKISVGKLKEGYNLGVEEEDFKMKIALICDK
jgi:hypothetical protein